MLNINIKELAKNVNELNITEVKDAGSNSGAVAIIGISAKLPMAADINEFWENLKAGRDCISDLPSLRREESDHYFRLRGRGTVGIRYKRGSYLDRLDEFDCRFFNISPAEANLMDPNQRMFLQIAWNAIEDAGYGGDVLKGSNTGVYCGFVSDLAYQRFIADADPSSIGISIPGNMASIIPGRVSYALDLKGPSILIDTACSSSLVAVHTACNAIRNGDCGMAVVGSVKMSLLPLEDDNMLGIESRSYICRAFDDDSDGTCMGEGVMAVVLKPLSKAVKDRDNIYAVIRGSAVNQDGTSMGITAPNVLSQASVIQNAWRDAGIDPQTIRYIETHGTGTKLGDPVEVDGIARAFSGYTDRKQFCAIGSVKTNLGHLDSAAGLAGMIKAVLALKHKQIPPSIHFTKPNRNIDFEDSPVFVNNELTDWEADMLPRRCGVSAFGLSGTNCHIVLEEAPTVDPAVPATDEGAAQIFTLSAKSAGALKQLTEAYLQRLEYGIEGTFGDMCFTVSTGRGHYGFRLAILSDNLHELAGKLSLLNNGRFETCEKEGIYYGEHKVGKSVTSEKGAFVVTEAEIRRMSGIAGRMAGSLRNGMERDSVLKELCGLYIKGADIDWNGLYEGEMHHRISLPPYPFERKRCWIDIPTAVEYENSSDILREQAADYETFQVGRALTDGKQAAAHAARKKTTLGGGNNGTYSETERLVAQIWGEILGFDVLDISDDFFFLGGDSIIAAKIANTLNQAGRQVKVSDILAYPSIQELAAFLDAGSENTAGVWGKASQPTIRPLGKQDHYSLSAAQKGIFAVEQFGNISTSYNMPVTVMIQGSVDKRRFESIFRELIARHEALRTSFQTVGDEPVQVIQEEFSFELGYAESDEAGLDRVLDGLVKPFDLAKAPLFRVCLVRLSEDRHILFYDMHHIIADGVSQAILLQEFKTLYHFGELPELTVQYKDYAAWHNSLLESEEVKRQEEFWLEQYKGDIPVLDMPLDYKRPEVQTFNGTSVEFTVDAEKTAALKELAAGNKTTLNNVLLCAYALLLGLYGKQKEVIVGSLTAGRGTACLENVIGMFVNFIPVKFGIDYENTFAEFLSTACSRISDAYRNQDLPFERIVGNVAGKLDRSRNPLFDTVFIFHNELKIEHSFEIEGLTFTSHELNMKTSKLDYKIDAYQDKSGGIRCVLEFNTSLFQEKSMRNFGRHFIMLLEKVLKEPGQAVSKLEILTAGEVRDLEEKRRVNGGRKKIINLAVSATFTSEPIEEYIEWWCGQFGMNTKVSFAPYNQMFQQLLDPGSILSVNDGINLLLVRFEDWIRNDRSEEGELYLKLGENFDRLLEILKTGRNTSTPLFAGIFPISGQCSLSTGMINYLKNMNRRWKQALDSSANNIHPIDFTGLGRLYGINELFDEKKDIVGHLPFSDEFYAAMGTWIARRICAWGRQPFKAIVLDCDNTLWKGVCGEDGAMGIMVDSNFAALQNLLIEKTRSGMLLALCSKNNEQDVWEVFEKNPQMLLKKEHFVSWRINWQVKSENIISIARELNLGLDSFIFMDDSPMECAQVMKDCPSVLTIRLPGEVGNIPAFLDHIWAFDVFRVTEEDRNRTEMYVTEKRRQELQDTRPSLEEFIRSLELKVSMYPMEGSQLGRVSQLTQRTNQFNLSTIRRTEEELQELVNSSGVKCWVVEVADRFGDYGLTGVVITREAGETVLLDTFLLSCRVLGRGVESAVLDCIGKYCGEKDVKHLQARFYPTPRNMPFREFLDSAGWEAVEGTLDYTFYQIETDRIPQCDSSIQLWYKTSYRRVQPEEERKKNEGKAIEEKKSGYPLDHIAIAVSDIKKARVDYAQRGFHCGEIVLDPLQNAYLSMCTMGGHDAVELVAPVNVASPVSRMLKDGTAIPYHLCYRVEELKGFLSGLSDSGIEYEIISEVKEAVLFTRNKVMFILVKNLGLIELLESGNIASESAFCNESGSETPNASDGRIKSSILRTVTGDPDIPARFFLHMGYIQEKSIHNSGEGIHSILFFKAGAGKIELMVPTDKTAPEYDVLQKRGPSPYELYQETAVDDKTEVLIQAWEVDGADDPGLFHRSYLLSLKNHTAAMLLGLPTYQTSAGMTARAEYEAPGNDTEEKLAYLWRELLRLEKIGVHDSFFELGGHSLKATTLISRISREFNVETSLTDIFRYPTIRQLAEHIASLEWKKYDQIGRVEPKEYYPLSSAQKRIFLIHQADNGVTSYNMPIAVRIRGIPDRKRMEEVFRKLISRHEALRTSFCFVNGDPVQIVQDEIEFKLDDIQTDEDSLKKVINNLVKPFDLSRAPLLRVCLIRTGQSHILYVEMHHIIADGVSYAILIREFMSLYAGVEPAVLEIQYKDYAAWHNRLLESERIKKQEKYWAGQFAEEIQVLDMPLDYDRPEHHTYHGSSVGFEADAKLVKRMQETAAEMGTTLNSVLLSLYAVLLSKYADQREITIGSVVAGRNHASLENVIGVFINYIPIRFEIDEGESAAAYMEKAARWIMEAYENQDYPYDRLVEAFAGKLSQSRNPLFDTVFILHNEFDAVNEFRAGELEFSRYELDLTASTLDLKVDAVLKEDGGLTFTLEYNTALFTKESMLEFGRHFSELLEQAGGDFRQTIGSLGVFTEEERHLLEGKRLLHSDRLRKVSLAVSATFTAEPVEEYISWWCRQFGYDVGVRFAPYNQVFQQLLDQESIISINEGVNILLVRFEDWIRNDTSELGEQILKLEENYERLVNLLWNWSSPAPCFVGIFPVSTHLSMSQGMTGYLNNMYRRLKQTLQSFGNNVRAIDFSGLDTLYGVDEIFDVKKDMEGHLPFSDEFFAAMGTWIARMICALGRRPYKAIVLDCDNMLWHGQCNGNGAMDAVIDNNAAALQKFLLEKTRSGMMITLCSQNNEQDVWNIFAGNPEMVLQKEQIASWRFNRRPIFENIKSIADELNLSFDSFIYMGADYEECAQVMRECPSVLIVRLPEKADRITAALEHIWAFDEPFHAESMQYPEMENCKAMPYPARTNDAWEQVAAVENRLGTDVPDTSKYFQNVIALAIENNTSSRIVKLPVGRISVKAPRKTGYRELSNKAEELLADIWKELLGYEWIGADDNFFELGGSSLKAITLVSRIFRESDAEVSISDIFEHPTISSLAELIDIRKGKEYRRIELAEEKEYYSLSSAQKRLLLMNRMESGSIAYNEAASVAVEGKLDRNKLEEIFRILIDRHEALRTSFELVNDIPVQKINKEADFRICFMEAQEQDLPELFAEFIRPFDLGNAPLFRVCLIRISEERFVIILDIHHIISDERSMAILISEFIKLYQGVELPQMRIQYKDFAQWQNRQREEGIVKRQEEYWVGKLSGEIPVLNLPYDFSRPAFRSFEGDVHEFNAGGTLFEKLIHLANDTGTTLYMILLAAFNILLYKYSGQEDIIVGSPILGRPHADLENIIGVFINTLPLRNYPGNQKLFSEFLLEVKESSLEAFDHQDCQLEDIVDSLKLRRSLSRNPLFDVVFSYHTDGDDNLQADGLKFTPYRINNKTSKFDLTLHVNERTAEIGFRFEYCTQLFRKETILKMAENYMKTLEMFLEDRHVKIIDMEPIRNCLKRERGISREVTFDFEEEQ
jgi:FkbH-like protein